jgi:hypothetical protein
MPDAPAREHSERSSPPGRIGRASGGPPWWLPTPLEVALLASFFLLTRHLSSCDLWWHLVVGRLTRQSGAIPGTDQLSLVSAGTDTTYPSWLWEVGASALVDAGGLGPLVALKGAVACLTLLLIVRLAWDSGARLPGALVVAMLVGLVSLRAQFWNLRPQMVTPLFAAAFLLVLRRHELGAGARRELAVLPVLMVLWANTHAGFMLGLALIGLSGASLAVRAGIGDAEASGRLRPLAGWAAATAAASLANPRGAELLFLPVFHVGSPTLASRITEWARTDLAHEPLLAAVLVSLVALLIAAPRAMAGPSEPLVLVSGLALAMSAVRHHFAVGSMIAPSMAVRAGALLAARRGPAAALAAGRASFPRSWPAWVVIGAWAATFWGVAEVPGQPGFYPDRAIRHLAGRGDRGPGFNQFELGGYMLYRMPAGYRAFIDGRVDAHIMSGGFERYLTVWDLRPGWDRELDRFGVRWALLEAGSALARALRARGWSTAVADDPWVLLVRP